MNPIIELILEKREGHYVHALEVYDVYELESFLDSFYSEFIYEFNIETIIDFCATLSIYCLSDENENEVYNFNITNYLKNL